MGTAPRRRPVLPASFFSRDTVSVARELLGSIIETKIRGAVTSGRIVEVEAYTGPDDPASHAANWRRTERNEAMYGPPGIAYVYKSYGIHWCLNAVTESEDFPAAVLVRALEPLAGIETMKRRRGQTDLRLLCAGPGRLCEALGIDHTFDKAPLTGPKISIFRNETGPAVDVTAGPRIGISRAASRPLRFALRGSRWLSRSAS